MNGNKKLKFEEQLQKYIQNLDEKEQKSYQRALSFSGQTCESKTIGETGSSECSYSGPSQFQGDS